MFTLTHALAHDIAGQKRTGIHKQFVFIKGPYVYKGPYQAQRLQNVLQRSRLFEEWNVPCVVKAIDYFTCPDGDFMRFPNVMDGYKLLSEPYHEEFSGLDYHVLTDSPVKDLCHSLATNPWIFDNRELVYALCCCNILGVGDMNFRNVLVDTIKQKLYIIDFDDNLGQDREDELFYFNRAPNKELKALWLQGVTKYYNCIAQSLFDATFDPEYIPRRDRIIALLLKHGKEKIPLLTLNIIRPVKHGHMVWKGLRGGASKTYSGIDFDVAKSALQKYIRRNMPQKAILVALELYRFGEVGGSAGVTNMYNRLAIIASEDIGPAHLPLVLVIIQIVENRDRDIARLAAMVQLLSESPKTRLMSHAWRAYANPEGRNNALKMGLPIDTTFTDADIAYINNSTIDIFLDSDPEHVRPYIIIFYKRLTEKDYNAFSWAYFFLETAKELTLTRRKKFIGDQRGSTGKPDILLWKALAKVLPPQTHNILIEAYYNHTEGRPFLQTAILTALNAIPYTPYDINLAVQVWQQQPSLQQMLNGDFTLEIDSFAIDKHTQQGRALGMTIQNFVEEGAVVIPQHPQYYDETLASIYKIR